MTCPTCFGERVVGSDDMGDPLGLMLCPMCHGQGSVAGDDPKAVDEVKQLRDRLNRARQGLESRERHIGLLHDIRRSERADAYRVAARHGFAGTYREFCDELYEAGRPKACTECARPLEDGV